MRTLNDDELRRLQLKSLDILLDFKQFCDGNSLTFFLCGGCCIGAVRHGGFIPWDDDIDLFMPRKDYERLHEIWQDTERYALLRTDGNTYCGQYNTTFVDKQSHCVLEGQEGLDIPLGIAIDIMPIDGCPSGRLKRAFQKINAMLFCLYNYGKPPVNHSRLINFACRILLMAVPGKEARTRLWQKCEKRMSKYSIDDCDKITELCSGTKYMQMEYPKEWFEKAVCLPFEGHMMPVPVGYDAYLRMAFGDYMKLPDENDRKGHHTFVSIDI